MARDMNMSPSNQRIAALLLLIAVTLIVVVRCEDQGLRGEAPEPGSSADRSGSNTLVVAEGSPLIRLAPDRGAGAAMPHREDLSVIQFFRWNALDAAVGLEVEARSKRLGGDWQSLHTDSEGLLGLEGGEWELRPVRSDLRFDRQARSRSDPMETVWVLRVGTLTLNVIDLDGLPVSGAAVRWFPKSAGTSMHGRSPAWARAYQETTTNSKGAASLDMGETSGELWVLARGFERTIALLSGLPKKPLTVWLPADHSGVSDLSVRSKSTAKPIAGARVLTGLGLVGVSDSGGRVDLASSLVDGDWIRVEAEGYVASSQRAATLEAGRVIELEPAATAKVRYEGASSDQVTLLTSQARLRGAPPSDVLRIDDADAGGHELGLPMGDFHFLAVDRYGRWGEARASITEAGQVVHISLSPEDTLVVSVEGNEIQRARVLVAQRRPLEIEALPTGSVQIPSLEGIVSVCVDVGASAVLNLGPHPRAAPGSLSGTLQLRAGAQCDQSFVVQTDEARPLPGMVVRLWPRNRTLGTPDLGGGQPTEHPNWVLYAPPVKSAVTNASGIAVFESLPTGLYRAEIATPPTYAPLGAAHSAFPPLAREVYLDGTERMTLDVPRPRRIAVEAFREDTGHPLRGMRIEVGERPTISVNGGRWEGWLPSTHYRIAVVADGLETEYIALRDGPDQEYAVFLSAVDRKR